MSDTDPLVALFPCEGLPFCAPGDHEDRCPAAHRDRAAAYATLLADIAVVADRDTLVARLRGFRDRRLLDGADRRYIRGINVGILYATREVDEPFHAGMAGLTVPATEGDA